MKYFNLFVSYFRSFFYVREKLKKTFSFNLRLNILYYLKYFVFHKIKNGIQNMFYIVNILRIFNIQESDHRKKYCCKYIEINCKITVKNVVVLRK